MRRGRPAELARACVGVCDPGVDQIPSAALVLTGCLPADDGAAIQNLDGRIAGVLRTYLKPDGTGKADVEPKKRRSDRERACAVHLTAGAPELVLCEGIETGLSILQATGLRVWAALGTSNLGSSRAARLRARGHHRGRPL